MSKLLRDFKLLISLLINFVVLMAVVLADGTFILEKQPLSIIFVHNKQTNKQTNRDFPTIHTNVM